MSQNWRKMAKMLHNVAKKFDWEYCMSYYYFLMIWVWLAQHGAIDKYSQKFNIYNTLNVMIVMCCFKSVNWVSAVS